MSKSWIFNEVLEPPAGQAAKVLGVTQPRVSDLMRGKIHLSLIDNLGRPARRSRLPVDLKVEKAA